MEIDVKRLSQFAGLDLAIGWIMASHDYETILHVETLLRRQRDTEEDESEISADHLFYLTRLRSAQTREAVGLCRRTKEVPTLWKIIKNDAEAKEAFNRLLKMDRKKTNRKMKLVRDVRDTTFHYCMRQHASWYQTACRALIRRGQKTVTLRTQGKAPMRFSPADELFNTVFLKEILRVNVKTPHAAGKRMAAVTSTLVEIGTDVQIVARALSNGLAQACSVPARQP